MQFEGMFKFEIEEWVIIAEMNTIHMFAKCIIFTRLMYTIMPKLYSKSSNE